MFSITDLFVSFAGDPLPHKICSVSLPRPALTNIHLFELALLHIIYVSTILSLNFYDIVSYQYWSKKI